MIGDTDNPIQPDVQADFHDLRCPLNYVYAKLLLEKMQTGQVLSVLVNEQGSRNVPLSTRSDGHEVLSVTPEGEYFRVTIRKGRGEGEVPGR